MFNILGALLWVVGVTLAGYLFGNLPWVKANLEFIIWGLILIPGLIAIVGAFKAKRQDQVRP
jgi:membrane-associated protein